MIHTVNPQSSHRLLWLSLAASLALNGFLIGSIANAYLTAEPVRRGLLSFELRSAGENLPVAEREALRRSVRELLPQLRVDWQRLRQLRQEINKLAAGPDPDRVGIDARLAEIREITASMQEQVQSRLFDDVLALPPETRALLRR